MASEQKTPISATTSPRPPAGRGEANIRLLLLGGFRLLHDGRPVAVPRGLQRTIALIGLRPGSTRTHLAGLLWPETPEERALSSLRTALWRLRQDSSCPFLTTGDAVRLHPMVRVDVDELVHAATAGNPAGHPRPVAPVLAAWRHDLLPGWYDDWVLLERERLRQLRLHLLDETARAHLRTGDHGAALQAALEAIAAEPLRETPHRLVVEAHLAEGNAYEALHAFYVYRDLVLRELQLEPSVAMYELINHILAPISTPVHKRRGLPGIGALRITPPA
jgi:DNA-binding SARP family transcriptional activator